MQEILNQLTREKEVLKEELSFWQKAKEDLECAILDLKYLSIENKLLLISTLKETITKQEEEANFFLDEKEQSIAFYKY